jgi:hypothetical protein
MKEQVLYFRYKNRGFRLTGDEDFDQLQSTATHHSPRWDNLDDAIADFCKKHDITVEELKQRYHINYFDPECDTMNLYDKAFWIMVEAHRGQVDKAGADYRCHPLMVAAGVREMLVDDAVDFASYYSDNDRTASDHIASKHITSDRTASKHADYEQWACCAALLHDTIEDTWVTPEYLREQGFPQEVIDAVLMISRRDDETYAELVARCYPNPIAKLVKIADLENNMDITRLAEVGDRDYKRLRKYLHSWRYLKGLEPDTSLID